MPQGVDDGLLLRVERVQAIEKGEELGVGRAWVWLGCGNGWGLFGLDKRHRREIVVGDGVVVDAGVDEGGVEVLVAEQSLDGGDFAASVEQLGGVGMAQLVRGYFEATSCSGRLEPLPQEILVQRLVAKEAEVVGGGIAPY